MTIRTFAPAKINLTLEITGRREDGYHLLSSLVVFATDVGDVLHAAPAPELALTVTGPLAGGVPTCDDNLVLRAARHLAKLRGVSAGAALTLEKHLPSGAGIGGGSSDAAAAVRALATLWGVDPLTPGEALELGADVPVCLLAPTPVLMSGIGDELRPVPGLPDFWLVLVNPQVHLETARVFRVHADLYGEEDYRQPGAWPDPLRLEDLQDWLLGGRNALTKCAAELTAKTGAVLEWFWNQEPLLDCDMSGSGSTCWGMFGTEAGAQSAAAALAGDFPDYWVRVAKISS